MKILLLSDIHGNLEALEAVALAVTEYDAIWCLGDTVGYGANPNECVDWIAERATVVLLGNHDDAAVRWENRGHMRSAAAIANKWTADNLGSNQKEYLLSLKPIRQMGDVLIAHGSPYQPLRHYVRSPMDAALAFDGIKEKVVFVGHTHQPVLMYQMTDVHINAVRPKPETTYQLPVDMKSISNIGSIGQPRDGDNRACYCIFDNELGQITWHRVEYDYKITQAKIREAGLPEELASRLTTGT